MNNPRNQAEAMTLLKNREKEFLERIFVAESEVVEFLQWADLPVTKKVLEKFNKVRDKCMDDFENQKWDTEAQGRGLAYYCRALGMFEKMIESYKRLYDRIQIKKQKEG